MNVVESEVWYSDMWQYNLTEQSFVEWGLPKPTTWPSERVFHASAIINGEDLTPFLFIYGGISQLCIDYCNDVWWLNLVTMQWQTDSGFSALNGPSKSALLFSFFFNQTLGACNGWFELIYFSFRGTQSWIDAK